MREKSTIALFVGSLMLLVALSPALAFASPRVVSGAILYADNSSWLSTNWSGYAVTGSSGSVSYVNGSWVVPAVTGTSTAYAAFWVGIDGFSSNTVEQTGTLSAIINGAPTYYAWYEFYPSPMYEITSVKIKPSDIIFASVTYTGSSKTRTRFGRGGSASTFSITINDTTTGVSYTTTGTVSNAARSSAEWIAEAPSSYSGVLPLANFGTVGFGYDNTQVAGTCFATVSGVSGAIGTFGSAVQEITMVTNKGVDKAVPSALSGDFTSFTVTWASAGP
jgi:hypothetical protein